MYTVVKAFGDAEDNYYFYKEGDVYPRKDKEVSEERLKLLASSENRMGTPLIKKKGTKK